MDGAFRSRCLDRDVISIRFVGDYCRRMDRGSIEEVKWIEKQRSRVEAYLLKQGLPDFALQSEPNWFVSPYVALWALTSQRFPARIGWWAISGDLPTDHVSSTNAHTAQEALRAFSKQWVEISSYLLRGEEHPTMKVGAEANRKELGDLLRRRAGILAAWANDDSMW